MRNAQCTMLSMHNAQAHAHAHAHAHTHTHTHTHTLMLTHTHTHTHCNELGLAIVGFRLTGARVVSLPKASPRIVPNPRHLLPAWNGVLILVVRFSPFCRLRIAFIAHECTASLANAQVWWLEPKSYYNMLFRCIYSAVAP